MIKRRKTKQIEIGGVKIGSEAPISVQSMCNTDTRDVKATVEQIKQLQDKGCELIRVAVLNKDAVSAIKEIKKQIKIPLIADIHFDYRLAIGVIENGIDALRINPGNIGNKEHTKKVVDLASKLEGMPRNTSTHACGVLIAPTPVDNYVPLARNGDDITNIVESFPDWKQGDKACISVKNHGETIPPEELGRLFERFHKTDRSRSRDRDGVGLGLYIVKSILNNHDEDVFVTSRDGVTEFVFTLALKEKARTQK